MRRPDAEPGRRHRLQALGVGSQVIGDALSVSLHAFLAWTPACRADFAVLFGELQRFDQTHHVVNVTTQRQVVDHLVLDNASLVDQERCAQCNDVVGL